MIALVRRLIVTALLASGGTADGLDLVVTRYDDPSPDGCASGDCSLREAVRAANATAGSDRILLSAGTYRLEQPAGDDTATTGDLDVLDSLEVRGVGAGMTTVDGGGLDRAFDVDGDTTRLLLAQLTVRGGSANIGGAVSVGPDAELVLEECEVRDNVTTINGRGAIDVLGFGSLSVVRSTIAGNAGDGVFCLGACTLESSTVSGNTRRELAADGGGGDVLCVGCTIAGSPTAAEVSASLSGLVVFTHSVVIGSCFTASGGVVGGQGGNVESPGDTCDFAAADDEVNAAAVIDALGANGGGTRTHATPAGSVARDLSAAASCPDTDQRGVPRPADGGGGALCDAGAVESTAADPPTPLFHDGFLQGSAAAWSDVSG